MPPNVALRSAEPARRRPHSEFRAAGCALAGPPGVWQPVAELCADLPSPSAAERAALARVAGAVVAAVLPAPGAPAADPHRALVFVCRGPWYSMAARCNGAALRPRRRVAPGGARAPGAA